MAPDVDPFPGPPQSFGMPDRYLVQIALIVAVLFIIPTLAAQLY